MDLNGYAVQIRVTFCFSNDVRKQAPIRVEKQKMSMDLNDYTVQIHAHFLLFHTYWSLS